jgi:type VI secretion system protein VasG
MLPALSRAILNLQLEKKPLTEARVSVADGQFAYRCA